jgi:hypothetical protein
LLLVQSRFAKRYLMNAMLGKAWAVAVVIYGRLILEASIDVFSFDNPQNGYLLA